MIYTHDNFGTTIINPQSQQALLNKLEFSDKRVNTRFRIQRQKSRTGKMRNTQNGKKGFQSMNRLKPKKLDHFGLTVNSKVQRSLDRKDVYPFSLFKVIMNR